jgi:hypothetical protein
LAVGCDGGTEDGGTGGTAGLTAVSGTANNTSGSGGSTGGGTGGTGMVAEGVPLPILDGWVDANEAIGIQGAIFAYGDATSKMGWMDKTLMGSEACLAGTAAKVDMMSTACTTMMFTSPATDCYGEYWGAAIGLNLNQPIDMASGKGVDPPLTFDAGAKAITGFAFEISGDPVPTSLRFKVENATGEFCNIGAVKAVMKGPNSFKFSELHEKCWEKKETALMNPTAEMGKSNLIKIAWQVVTNTTAAVPFNYCVSNIRALTN